MAAPDTPTPEAFEGVGFADFVVDVAGHTLTGPDGRDVPMTRAEFALLLAFLRAPGRVLSRDYLLDAVAGRRSTPFDRGIDVLVSRLRHKIEPDPSSPHLILTVPGVGYRFTERPRPIRPEPTIRAAEPHPLEPELTLALPDKPSIAVLPFQNMSGDAGQECFVDGLTEEIVTALSRVPSFFVVARPSAFTVKGTSPNIRQVGRELCVCYVLGGSVRKAGDRVRITSQLIDAVTGLHIWADRFDGALTDIIELQDQAAASIVGAIEPKLQDAEIERARQKPVENLRAYDLVLRGRFALGSEIRDGIEEAVRLLRRAVDMDANHPLAQALLALSNFNSAARHWTTPTEAELAEYVQLARDAVRRGSEDPEVLVPAAHVIAMAGGDFSDGFAMMERACVLNDNSAEAWANIGFLRAYTGEIGLAINHLERSRRLSPGVSFFQYVGFTLAHFVAGNYDEAVNWTAAGLGRYPTHVPLLRYRAATLGLVGRTAEAQRVVQRLLALVPDLTMARVRHHVEVEMKNPYKKLGVVEAYYEGLRRAGLPE